jgi:hypothetical protein
MLTFCAPVCALFCFAVLQVLYGPGASPADGKQLLPAIAAALSTRCSASGLFVSIGDQHVAGGL